MEAGRVGAVTGDACAVAMHATTAMANAVLVHFIIVRVHPRQIERLRECLALVRSKRLAGHGKT
jgi:hypothetical protein